MTDSSKLRYLPNAGMVMLRGKAKRAGARADARFAPKSLSFALASAYQAAGLSISQAITGLSITLAGLSGAHAQSQASNLPQGGVAVHGSATMQQNGNTLNVNTINGAGNKSAINWQSFNIGAGHTTNINQPNAQSSSLNRVITNAPSQIYGTLRSNGQVILVNQNGIAVGSGGVVDTAGFTASTLNISDADYKANRLRFEGNALSGGVQVDGVIRSSNGDIVLFAPQVSVGKAGAVKADNGNVIVGAGQSVELTGRGLEGVKFLIQGADNKAINLGTLQGNAVGVFAGTLRHSGVISAQSASMEGGKVVLRAVRDVEIVKDASLSKAPVIEASGGVNAQGLAQKGGSIQIESALGNVLIGAGSQIAANAGNVNQNPQFPDVSPSGGAITIIANQGRVITEAGSQISATGQPGGTIRLFGGQEARIASIINASSPSLGAADAAGTLVLLSAQDVGGRIEILSPQTVSLLTGAQLLASGDAGGGTILVGGDYQGANAAITNAQNTNISSGVLLEANARVNGNGGKAIVWADNDTHFSGTLHAKGGDLGGDGGFGETSGKKNLYFRGRADLSARRGRAGTLLLDPETISIQGGSGASNDPDGLVGANDGGNISTSYTITESLLESLSTNISLEAANYIQFQGTFVGNGLTLANGFTLSTRNAPIDTGISQKGIYLGGWGNSTFTISAGGNIAFLAGTGWTGTVLNAPSINANPASLLSIVSGSGNITLEAAGSMGLGSGLNLLASTGDVLIRSKLSTVALGEMASAGVNITAKNISLETQAADGLISILGSAVINATATSGNAISLRGDRLAMDSSPTLVAANASILIRPNDNARLIKLSGVTDTTGSGALQISQAEFDNLSANKAIRFGDTTSFTGNIEVGTDTLINVGSGEVALLSNGGSITQLFAITANQLRLEAGSITLNNSTNSFPLLAARSSTGPMNISTGSLNTFLNAVDGLSGLQSAGTLSFSNTNLSPSQLNLTNDGNIGAQGNINIAAFETIQVFGGGYFIDSNTSNLGASGNISLGSAVIYTNTFGRNLTLDASSSDAAGGNISFGNVTPSSAGSELNNLTVNSSGTTAGQIILPASITIGSGGASITGRVNLVNAVAVTATGSGAITFNGEIQGNNTLNLTSDAGAITLNSIAGNGTAVGTVDIFSASGTVNLNKNITTSAGTNVNVVAGNINVGNNAEIYAGGLVFLQANGTAASNTLTTGTGSVLHASTGLMTLLAEDNITLNGNVSGNSNISINSSAGAVNMSSTSNVLGYQTTLSPGSLSISVHGQTGVTLAQLSGSTSNNYNAVVTTGAGQTIANAGSTNLAGFNSATLGSAGARSNIGSSGSRIAISDAGEITAYAANRLYLNSSSITADVTVATASIDATSAAAVMEITSERHLQIFGGSGISVLGANNAEIKLGAAGKAEILTGISGNGALSSVFITANDKLVIGGGAQISNLGSLQLAGKANNQAIRIVDSDTVSTNSGSLNIAYGSLNQIQSTVGHVVIGNTNLSGGNITFEGTSAFNFAPTGSKNYSFFSGGNISSTDVRNMNLVQAGFSAGGNIALNNVSIANSVAPNGVILAASAGGTMDLKVADADGVTLTTVGSSLPMAAQLTGLTSTGTGDISLTNLNGGVTSGTANFDIYAGAGKVTVKANQDIGTVANPLAIHASGFTLGNEGGGVNQNLIAVALTRNSSGTVQTSDTSFDTGNHLNDNIYIKAGVGTTTLEINDGFGTGNAINRTLSNASGDIRVTQANALFSGTGGTMTLNANSTTFEKLTSIAAGNTVSATGGNSTITSSLGGLSGDGTFNNTGKTLIVDGTLAPGSGGIGTLTVNGSVSMGSTGFLDVDIGTTVNNGDRLVVGQDFTAGGLLRIKETNLNTTVVGTNYTVASIGGTSTGGFVSVIGDTGFFSATLGAQLTVSAASLINYWVNNAGSTLWSGAGNWSRGVVPTADHNVEINPTGVSDTNKLVQLNGGTSSIRSLVISGDDQLQITGGATLSLATISSITAGATLDMAGGTLNGAGDISIAGALNWSSGTIGGSGTLNTASGVTSTLNGGGARTLYRSWNNQGTVNLSGTGYLHVWDSLGTLNNQTGGIFNVTSTYNAEPLTPGGAGQINNQGTINWNTGIANNLHGAFANQTGGVVNVQGTSQLNLLGNGTDTGQYSISSGAGLRISGTRSLAAGSNITGVGTFTNTGASTISGALGIASTGTVVQQAGTLTLDTSSTSLSFANPLLLSGGVLNGSNDLHLAGGLLWTSGYLDGTGTLYTSSGVTSTLNGIGGRFLYRSWNNQGTINLETSYLHAYSPGILNNQSGGIVNVTSTGHPFPLSAQLSSGAQINNQGTINWNTGVVNTLHGSFSNQTGGVVNVQGASSLTVDSTFTQNDGTIAVAAGSTFAQTNGFTNNGLIQGAGTINVGTGTLTNASGGTIAPGGAGSIATLSIAGHANLTSGNLLFDLGNTSGDRIAVTGDLVAGGASAKLYETGGLHLDVTDAYSLVTYSGNLTGTPLSLLSQNTDIGFISSSTGSSAGALVATASSVINRWIDASGTVDWGTASNWSRAHVPTATEDVFINPTDIARAVTLSSGTQTMRSLTLADDDSLRIAGGTLNLTTLSSVTSGATLNVAGGAISGAGDFIIDGRLNWSSGTIGGTGDMTTTASSIISGLVTLQRDWSNTSSIILNSGASSVTLQNSATLTNSGSLQVNSTSSNPLAFATGSAVTNSSTGTIDWNGTGSGAIGSAGQFHNHGTVNVNSGTLRILNAGITDTGTYDIDSGQQLEFTAVRAFGATSNITGAGTVHFAGGTQTIDSTAIGGLGIAGTGHVRLAGSTVNLNTFGTTFVNPLTVTGTSFLQGSADITIASTTGGLNWGGGRIGGTGDLITPANANTSITGDAILLRDWTNSAAITMGTGSTSLELQGTALLTNSGTMQVNSTSATPLTMALGATVTNTGTINWNSGISNSIGGLGIFNNNNLVNIDNGVLSITAASGTDGGTYDVDTGKRLNFAGNRSLAAGSNVTGLGTLGFTNGTQTVSSSITGGLGIAGTGHVRVEGAIVNLNTANTTFANVLTLTAGNLQGSADYTLTSGMNWSNSTLGGSGVLYTPTGSTSVLSSGLIINRRWENAGTVNMAAGTNNFLYSNNTLVNAAGGVMNIQSTRNTADVISMNTTNGQFNNAGTLNWNTGTANGGMSGTTNTSFNNTGTVNVSGSSNLNLPLPIFTQTGKIDIASGGTLTRSTGFANAGTLSGGGSINVGTNSFTSVGGTISPGGAGSVATLSIAGHVDLTGATLLFDLGSASSYDKIAVSGNLNQSASSLQISELAGSPFVSGSDSFNLVSYVGTLSGTAPTVSSNITDVSFGALTNTGTTNGALVAVPNSVINRWSEAAVDLQWTNAANWSRGHAPTALEDAYISPSSATAAVTLTGASGSVRSLQLASDDSLLVGSAGVLTIATLSVVGGTAALNLESGATINGAGELRIEGDLNWSGGSVTGSGDLDVRSGGDVVISGAANLERSLFNASNVTISGTAGALTLGGTAVIDNTGSGTLKIVSTAASPISLNTAANHVNNAGTVIWNTGGNGAIAGFGTFNNTNSVSVGGTNTVLHLSATGGGVDTGGYTLGAGSRMNFAGGVRSLSAAASVTGMGTLGSTSGNTTINSGLGVADSGFVIVSGGNLSLNSATDLSFTNPLIVSGGSLQGSADFSLASGGALNWSGGSIAGSGTLYTASGSNSSLTGTPTIGRVWENEGQIDILAGMTTINSTLTNLTGGVINVDSNNLAGALNINSAASWLMNTGGLIQWNTGIDSAITGSGTFVNNNSGTLSILGGATLTANSIGLTQLGTLDVASGGTLLRTNGLVNSGLIRGSGTINTGANVLANASGATLAPGDSSSGAGFGTLTVQGGLTMADNSHAVFGLSLANSDLINVTGDVTFSGVPGPTLTVSEAGGASLLGGELRTLIAASGTLTSTAYASTGSGDLTFALNQTGSNFEAQVIGIANTWAAAMPAGGFWSTGINWSRGTAPNAYHDVTINQGSTNLVNVSGMSHARSLNLSGADNTLHIGLGGSLALHHGNDGTVSSNSAGATLQISGGGTLAIGGSAGGIGTLNQAASLIFTGSGTISALGSSSAGGHINNTGTLSMLGGASDIAAVGVDDGSFSVTLLNTGTISAQSGALKLMPTSVTNQGLFDIGSSGTLYLENTFSNEGTINLGGGVATLEINGTSWGNTTTGLIKGAGTITGASGFTSAGTVAPGLGMTGLGTLTINNGGYTQDSTGFLDIRTDATGSDVLNVLGGATLDGTVRMSIRPASGHAFAAGQVYEPLVATSVGGAFAAVTGTSPYVATTNYALGAQVTLSNPAGSIVWDGSAGDFQWDNPLNWNLDRLPGLGDTVIINPAAVNTTITLDTGSGFTLFQLPGDDTLLINTGGSLGLPGGSALSGLLHVNGGILDILGTSTADQLTMSNGQVNLSGGNLSIGTLALNGGQLFIGTGHTASLTTTGTWGGSSSISSPIGSPGTFAVGANVPFVISGSGTRDLSSVVLNNAGTLWMGMGSAGSGGTLGLNDGALIINGGSASIISQVNSGNQVIHTVALGAGTLVNAGGHVEARSGSSLTVDTSSLSVAGGSYNAPGLGIFFEAINNSYSGALSISSGVVKLDDGVHTFASGASLSGAGVMDIDAAGNQVNFNNFTLDGILAIHAGEMNVNAGQTFTVAATTGYLDVWQSVGGSGTIHNLGTLQTYATSNDVTIAPNVVNDGTFEIASSSTRTVELTGGLSLNSGGSLRLLNDSHFKRSAGIVNNGAISSDAGGNATLNVGSGGYSGAGHLSPGDSLGVATLTIAGNADFTPGTVDFSLQNASSVDRIHVTGNANLGGAFTLSEIGSPFVAGGDVFTLVTAGGTMSGSAVLNSNNGDLSFTPSASGGTLSASASTVINRWNTDTGGLWGAASNWTRGHMPNALEDVVIDRSAANPTVSIGLGLNASARSISFGAGANDNLQISSTGGTLNLGSGGMVVPAGSTFTVEAGKVQGAGNIEINGRLHWSGGEIAGAGNLVVQAGGITDLSVASSIVLSRAMVNHGTVDWDAGEIQINGSFTNESGGTFNAAIADHNTDLITGSGVFYNNGSSTLLMAGGAASLGMNVDFRNSGLVRVNTMSSLDLHVGATHSGVFDMNNTGASLRPRGTSSHVFTAASTIEGAGRLVQDTDSPQTSILGAYTIAQTDLIAGSLGFGNGGITVSNLFMNGGTLGTSAALSLGATSLLGGTLNVASGQTLSLAGSTVLNGEVIGTGSGELRNLATGALSGAGTLGVGTGLFRNLGTIAPGTGATGIATITIAGDADFTPGILDIGLQNISTYDKLAVLGNLTSGGTLKLTHTSAPFVSVGDAFHPVSYTGSFSGTAPAVDSVAISGVAFSSTNGASNSALTLTAGMLGGIFWDGGGGDGLWSNALNWSTNLLPIAGQNVTLNPAGSGAVTVASGTNISGLTGMNLDATDALFIIGGTLALPSANLFLNGVVNLQGGTIVGNAAGGVLGSTLNWSGGSLAGAGTYSAGVVSLGSGTGSRVLDGMTLNAGASTLGGGQLSLLSGQFNTGSSGFMVSSLASLSFDGGALVAPNPGFTNLGRVNINTGSISLNNTAIQSGSFSIASGANLAFANDVTLTPAASVSGGSWAISSSKTVTAQGSLNRGSGGVTFVNGKLDFTGTTPVASSFETDQLIMLSGGSIHSGGVGALTVTQAWDDSSIGAGGITGFADISITQTSGSLNITQSLSASDTIIVQASSGSISSGAAMLSASGSIAATASGLIDLNVTSPMLSAQSTSGDVALNITGAADIVELSTASGNTAFLTSSADIGQSGPILTSGLVQVSNGANALIWSNTLNQFGGGVHLVSTGSAQVYSASSAPLAISGNAAELTLDGGVVQLGRTSQTLGTTAGLTVVASSNITQGAALNIGAGTFLQNTALNGTIHLPMPSRYVTPVLFSSSQDVLIASSGNLQMQGSAGGTLSLSSTSGDIVGSGAVSAGALASFQTTGSVLMTNASNTLPQVSFNASSLNLRTLGDLSIYGTSSGSATLQMSGDLSTPVGQQFNAATLSMLNTGVSQVAVNMQAGVSGATYFNPGTAGYSTIQYSNAQDGSYGNINASGSVSLTHTSATGSLTLPQITATAGSVTAVSANGSITQSGALFTQLLQASAPLGDITLAHINNSFDEVQIAAAQDVSLRTVATLDPNIAAAGSVSIQANGINQSAGNAINSVAFNANVAGGLGLFGLNNLGSLSASVGADMDVNNSGDLALGAVSASGSNGVVIHTSGALTQSSGQVSGAKVDLQAASIGSAAQPVQLASAAVRLSSDAGDIHATNSQAASIDSLSSAGSTAYTSSAATASTLRSADTVGELRVSTNGLNVQGSVNGAAIWLNANAGDLRIEATSLPTQVAVYNPAGNLSLQGQNVEISGGTLAGAWVDVFSAGTAQVNAAGNFIVRGGAVSDAYAQFNAGGDVTITSATAQVIGGAGSNAFAKLDPALGSLLTINSGSVDVIGGSGAGAYALIVSDGDIVFNGNSLNIQAGSGADADAVVMSQFGLITLPGNCNGCVNLNASPMQDGGTQAGIFEGGRVISESNAPIVLSTQLNQIDAVLEELTQEPPAEEEEKKGEPDIVIEGQTCL